MLIELFGHARSRASRSLWMLEELECSACCGAPGDVSRSAHVAAQPPRDPCAAGPGPQSLNKAQGENVLAANCGSCHGPQLESVAGGVGPINDLQLLSEQGFILPCDPERSPIVQSIRSGAMPPPASGLPPVTPQDVRWIRFIGWPRSRR